MGAVIRLITSSKDKEFITTLYSAVSYLLIGTVWLHAFIHVVCTFIWNVHHLRLVELPLGGERPRRVLQPKALEALSRPGEENVCK